MATTTPDSLRSPNPTDPFNLVSDWATSMQSVQTALVKRGNYYVGTSAQRTAFTSAPEGVHWQDTDGSKYEWVRRSGAWRGAKPISGVTPLSGAANADRTANISFPSGYFASTPVITATAQTTSPWNADGPSFTNGSPTGATLCLRYATATTVNVNWTATP